MCHVKEGDKDYLDDFIMVGGPRSDKCQRANDVMLSKCEQLGMPVACEKCEGPSLYLVLGIKIDAALMQLSFRKKNEGAE